MLPFWNAQGIKKQLIVTPRLVIIIRKTRKLNDILQVKSQIHESVWDCTPKDLEGWGCKNQTS